MSVETEADKKLNIAIESVKEALLALNEILIIECEGCNDYSAAFYGKMEVAYDLLLQTRSKLKSG